MRILYFLADTFINTFGITQPDARTRQQAAWFIAGLMVAVLVSVGFVGYLLSTVLK